MSVVAVSCGILALSVTARSDGSVGAGGLAPNRELSQLAKLPARTATAASTLRVKNVRLEAPPPDAPKPSAVLKFDLLNDGLLSVTDVLVEISILEKQPLEAVTERPRVMVGPFTVRGNITLESGYTTHYEMLLRNFSSDCGCVPNVTVTSAGAVDSGS